MRFAIKVCATDWSSRTSGDYHFALALAKYLKRSGHETALQVRREWYDGEDADCDVVIHLRGVLKYHPSPRHFNIMWNISHPDLVSPDEYEQYDLVFVASCSHAQKLKNLLKTNVEPLLQCTDPEVFFFDPLPSLETDLLFVGNTRGVFRKILQDLLPTEHKLAVYGRGWRSFIDKRFVRGKYFPNEDLRKLYSSCKALLSDHFDDMREGGFINNRIFDALACGAIVIADRVSGMEDVLGEAVKTYEGKRDLHEKIDNALKASSASDGRNEIIQRIASEHSFANRALDIVRLVNQHYIPKARLQKPRTLWRRSRCTIRKAIARAKASSPIDPHEVIGLLGVRLKASLPRVYAMLKKYYPDR